MNEWIDAWIDEWEDGYIDKWTNRKIKRHISNLPVSTVGSNPFPRTFPPKIQYEI